MKRYELRITPQGNGGAMIPDKTGGWVMHHSVKELETLVAQQAAVIEQKNKALQEISRKANLYDVLAIAIIANEALTLQSCPEVLNKVRAEAVREAAKQFGAGIDDDLLFIAQRIEQGEA